MNFKISVVGRCLGKACTFTEKLCVRSINVVENTILLSFPYSKLLIGKRGKSQNMGLLDLQLAN